MCGSEEGLNCRGELAFGAMVEHQDSGVRWSEGAPGDGPTAPGIVEKNIVLAVVGQEYSSLLRCGKPVFVVARVRQSRFLGSRAIVAGGSEQEGKSEGDIVIEVEAGHAGGQSLRSRRASMYFL